MSTTERYEADVDAQTEAAEERRYIEHLHAHIDEVEHARDELLNTLRALALEEQAQPQSRHRDYVLAQIAATLEALS